MPVLHPLQRLYASFTLPKLAQELGAQATYVLIWSDSIFMHFLHLLNLLDSALMLILHLLYTAMLLLHIFYPTMFLLHILYCTLTEVLCPLYSSFTAR